MEIETPHGLARAHVYEPSDAVGALVLGHGAGGGITARDLATATDVALSLGTTVVLVEQPYRVAGRRSPAPAAHLDTAWVATVEHLRADTLGSLPLVVGGRSSGARVACRTADRLGAYGVLCLAFPLQPPRRRTGAEPPSRLDELDGVTAPVLVVQGARDPFGMPPAGESRSVAVVEGDHSLRTDHASIAGAIRGWLPTVLHR